MQCRHTTLHSDICLLPAATCTMYSCMASRKALDRLAWPDSCGILGKHAIVSLQGICIRAIRRVLLKKARMCIAVQDRALQAPVENGPHIRR